MSIIKKYLKWIICLISFIIFLIIAFIVITKNDIFIDSFMYNKISKYISSDLTHNMKYLTYMGSAIVVITITLLALLFIKNKKVGLYMSLNLILITIFQLILKNIFARNRPVDINLIEETGYSFPSGHSLTVMAFYGFIIYLIHISSLNKRCKILYISLLSLIILVVGLSRIYLGVHFFTDVIGAFTFSLSYLIIFIHLIKGKLKS